MEQTEEKYEGEMKDGKRHGFGTLILPDGTKYVGEFKNGKYDGSGKLSYSNMDYYEGHFKEGKLNGIGKYFYGQDCTMAKYEGELINGKKHGKGVSVYLFRNHEDIDWYSFQNGSFVNDKQNGYGLLIEHVGFTTFNKDESLLDINSESYIESPSWKKYEGEFINGEKHGNGKYKIFDKKVSTASVFKYDYYICIYEGGFSSNLYHGEGVFFSAMSNSVSENKTSRIYYRLYIGNFICGKYDGKGTLVTFESEGFFKDEFQNFSCKEIDEKVYLTKKDWRKYEGDFIEGEKNGEIIVSDPTGILFKGIFKSGKKNGLGTKFYSDGKSFTGEFVDGFINGQGSLQLANGEKYIGHFKEEPYIGTLKLLNGSKYRNETKIMDEITFQTECALFIEGKLNELLKKDPLTGDILDGMRVLGIIGELSKELKQVFASGNPSFSFPNDRINPLIDNAIKIVTEKYLEF